jgi:hypothetical protein
MLPACFSVAATGFKDAIHSGQAPEALTPGIITRFHIILHRI